MPVPLQATESMPEPEIQKGAAARTRALMVATAAEMMRRGLSPSVSEVAEAAGVSRSTAYRYFPTQAEMLRAVIARALGPILDWDDPLPPGAARLASLYRKTFPRMAEHEATFRAALRQSLEPDTGNLGDRTLGRGHRLALLSRAIGESGLPAQQATRLMQALSLTFGIEAMIVLKDICGLNDTAVEDTALWAAQAMLRAAQEEAGIAPRQAVILVRPEDSRQGK